MDKHRPPITPGCTVLLAGFDDIPEHAFLVEEVFEDLITGQPSQDLSLGNTENQTSRWFCGCSQHQPSHRTKQSRQSRARQGRA